MSRPRGLRARSPPALRLSVASEKRGRDEGWAAGRPCPRAACHRVAAGLRRPLAARRSGGGDRGHRSGGAEEPRLRGHRGGAAAERALRGRRRGDHLRALLHFPSHLYGAELVAGGRRGRRGRGDRASAGTRRRSWWRRLPSSPGCCSCCSRSCGWGGSPSFLSKAVVTGFLAGAAVDVITGELPKLTGTSAEGDNAWRELGSWLGSLGDTQGTTLVVGISALAVILALRRLAPAVPGALVLVVGGCWRHRCSTSARTGWRWSATCRAAFRFRRCPTWGLSATTPRPSRSRRWRCC